MPRKKFVPKLPKHVKPHTAIIRGLKSMARKPKPETVAKKAPANVTE